MIATKNEYLEAVNKATVAAKSYYDSAVQVMSDAEYDLLIEEIEAAGQAYGWTEGIALLDSVAGGASTGGDVEHTVPMLSLGKVKTLEDVKSFVSKHSTETVVFEPKLDGLAISAVYTDGKLTRVATRGDGRTGENITTKALSSNIKGLPTFLSNLASIEVRGEIFIGNKDFEVAQVGRMKARGEVFANSRNAVAGSLRTSKDTSYVAMTFGAYDVIGLSDDSYTKNMAALGKLGFIPAISLVPSKVKNAGDIVAQIEAFGVARVHIDSPTDGAVVKFDSLALRERMGAASRHPRWAVAFKYEAELVQTKLTDIVREVGRTGAISYVGILNPVEIEGSLVGRVTLNNSSFISSLDLHLGDTVFVRKANSIIPQVESVNLSLRPSDAVPYVAPTTCPKCGEPLDVTSSIVWRCTNPEDAAGSLITYAASREMLDIDGLSTAIVDALFTAGLIDQLSDLYLISEDQLAGVKMGVTSKGADRLIGHTVAKKLYTAIQKSKEQPLNRVISSLGIRMTGRTFGRRLATHFGTMENIQKATVDDFHQVEGVALGRAEAFVAGFKRNADLIANLRAVGFASLQPQAVFSAPKAPEATTAKGNFLEGLSVVVTGAVEGYSRTEIGELVESLGGRASSSISSKTGLVIIGANAGSKADKAKSLGVRTMTAEQFLAQIK